MSDDPVGGAAEEPVLEEDDRAGRAVVPVVSVEPVEGEDVAVRGHHSVLSPQEPSIQDQLHLKIYRSSHFHIITLSLSLSSSS